MELPKGPASMVKSNSLPVHDNGKETQRGSTPTSGPLISTTQVSRPYLTQNQIRFAQRGNIDNRIVYDQRRNQIFGFLTKICNALKFPMRALESSMIYYQRFFLHNKFDVASYYDVAITCLFIAIKNEDTVKKLRDIIIVSAQLRNVQLNNEQIENYRKKLMIIEFKILETISFDFRVYHVEEWIVKIGKSLRIPKDICYLSWLIAFDSYQLEIALKIPANSIAIAILKIACLTEDQNLNVSYKEYQCSQFAVNEAMIDILDFYINQFNLSNLSVVRPDLKNTLFQIKLSLADDRVLSEKSKVEIENDGFFKPRDFTVGERRYMWGNQRKRLCAEFEKSKKL